MRVRVLHIGHVLNALCIHSALLVFGLHTCSTVLVMTCASIVMFVLLMSDVVNVWIVASVAACISVTAYRVRIRYIVHQ